MQGAFADATQLFDSWGRPAWIALMVLGFILFWPIGLAILAFLIWSGRMSCGRHGKWDGNGPRAWGNWKNRATFGSTGNAAFDEYRSETIRRLEEEARDFRTFLEKLRFAKDKEEFDRFMSDRANAAREAGTRAGEAGQPA